MLEKKTVRAILWTGMILAFVSLFRSTLGQATDFEVFWRVGKALRDGQPFYDVSRDAGMVFKYPPWIAPFFYPLGFLDFVTAKGVWAMIELVSLLGILWSLRKNFRVSELSLLLLFPLFWGIWVIHFLDGQVSIPVLAVFLFFLSRPKLSPAWSGFLPLILSIKVFTLYPLLAVLDRFRGKRAIYSTVVLGVAFSGATALLSFHGDVGEVTHRWLKAAQSGGQTLNPGQTRGSKNQSVVSYLCRVGGVPASDSRTEVLLSVGFFLLAHLLLQWKKALGDRTPWIELTTTDYVFVYLALTAPLHPLPWHHLYVWVFPLAAYRFDRDARRPLYWASIFLICFSSERAIPFLDLGRFLEWNVGRAWGALLLVAQTQFQFKRAHG